MQDSERFDKLVVGSLSDVELVEYCQQTVDLERVTMFDMVDCSALKPEILKELPSKALALKRLKRNQDVAKTELCRRYIPLIQKYAAISHTQTMRDDVEAHLWMLLLEAIDDFDVTGPIPFAGFIKSRIKFGHWNYYKKLKRHWDHESSLMISYHKDGEEDESVEDFPSEENVANHVVNRIVETEALKRCMVTLDKLSDKERSIISAVYNQEKTLAEIGREQGCSRQNIKYYHDKALARLRQVICEER